MPLNRELQQIIPDKAGKDIDGIRSYTVTYHSLLDFAAAAEERIKYGRYKDRRHYERGSEWSGGDGVDTVMRLARDGWDKHLDASLEIMSSAVELVEKEHEELRPEMTFDVAGDYVDIGRYLAGEPECMIDYPLTPVANPGKVITLCASVCYSSALSADTIVKRGQIICAFALALSRLGHSIEMWADMSSGSEVTGRVRVLVKGADETLDPARILFAYAHPAFLRVLGFMVWDGSPYRQDQGAGYGQIKQPLKDLPEGTIYLPPRISETDVKDADLELKKLLGKIGLIGE